MKVAAMTSLTLTVASLVDFLLDSVLEGVCFLLQSEVQAHLTVLRCVRNERGVRNRTLRVAY